MIRVKIDAASNTSFDLYTVSDISNVWHTVNNKSYDWCMYYCTISDNIDDWRTVSANSYDWCTVSDNNYDWRSVTNKRYYWCPVSENIYGWCTVSDNIYGWCTVKWYFSWELSDSKVAGGENFGNKEPERQKSDWRNISSSITILFFSLPGR